MFTSLMTIYAAGKAMGVPAAILVAICTQESGLKNTTNINDGGSPSHGVCQIKLGTAQLLKDKYKISKKVNAETLKDPVKNAYWAALYLKFQLQRYDDNLCMAVPAYNSGTFLESATYPGTAKNYGYIKRVQQHLPDELKYLLDCPRKQKNK